MFVESFAVVSNECNVLDSVFDKTFCICEHIKICSIIVSLYV